MGLVPQLAFLNLLTVQTYLVLDVHTRQVFVHYLADSDLLHLQRSSRASPPAFIENIEVNNVIINYTRVTSTVAPLTTGDNIL